MSDYERQLLVEAVALMRKISWYIPNGTPVDAQAEAWLMRAAAVTEYQSETEGEPK
jgi:hypothetical protein